MSARLLRPCKFSRFLPVSAQHSAAIRFIIFALMASIAGCDDHASPSSAVENVAHAVTPNFDRAKKTQALSTGISIAYVEAGNPGGEVAIFLHGYTDTSRSFFRVIDELISENSTLHIYALDQRGHGGSSMPSGSNCPGMPEECFQPAVMAADVVAFMDARGITAAHVVGHSMGSLVAQELALARADRVDSLILIGTFVYSAENPTFNDFLVPLIEGRDPDAGQWRGLLEDRNTQFSWPDDAYDLTPQDADPDAIEFMATVWVTDPTADPDFLAEIVPETTATKLGTWIGALRAQHAFDSRQRLVGLTVPVLVIWATQDNLFPVGEQQRVKSALDSAVDACNLGYIFYKTYGKLRLPESGSQVTDIGHNVHWGAYEAIAADISAWITTGAPTVYVPYADSTEPTTILSERDGSNVIEKRRSTRCEPS